MTITAKFDGKCIKCGGKIAAGEEINWEKGKGAWHLECPANPEPAVAASQPAKLAEPKKMTSRFDSKCVECGLKITAGEEIYYLRGKGAWHTNCAAAKEAAGKLAAERKAAAPYRIGCGSGYGGQPYTEGEVLAAPKHIVDGGGPAYLYVVEAGSQYYRYDGMSFGVGDDSGYIYRAECREATAEEAAPLLERERKAAERKAAQVELKKVIAEIKDGEKPEGMNSPQGEILLDTFDIYGSGERLIVGSEYIWYVRNNGMDGDDWGHNNVRTSGAGAIGWRVPHTESLAERLATLLEAVAGIGNGKGW